MAFRYRALGGTFEEGGAGLVCWSGSDSVGDRLRTDSRTLIGLYGMRARESSPRPRAGGQAGPIRGRDPGSRYCGPLPSLPIHTGQAQLRPGIDFAAKTGASSATSPPGQSIHPVSPQFSCGVVQSQNVGPITRRSLVQFQVPQPRHHGNQTEEGQEPAGYQRHDRASCDSVARCDFRRQCGSKGIQAESQDDPALPEGSPGEKSPRTGAADRRRIQTSPAAQPRQAPQGSGCFPGQGNGAGPHRRSPGGA